jgi:hypothetical protein
MSNGGWYLCPISMIGTTFGVYSKVEYVNFVEAMAYSQEAIHWKAAVIRRSREQMIFSILPVMQSKKLLS